MCEDAKRTFRRADCVTFDVDSTVCTDEGIDELAAFLGRRREVEELTERAMEGEVPYAESLRRRLDILRPSLRTLAEFRRSRPPRLSPGIERLVGALRDLKVPVFLISGGFHELVDGAAESLRIPLENVFANRILFDADGNYSGLDEEQPTCRDSGKAEVVGSLKDRYGYRSLVHVGDGVTDARACPPADAFVGYGGSRVREAVRSLSGWYVTNFDEMLRELDTRGPGRRVV